MYQNLLPIGSIVLLKEGQRKLMICGRIVTKGTEAQIYDYVGCVYPQGVVSSSNMYFFNRDAIDMIYFIGFQDQEELQYRHALDQLGELEIVDGKIVEKK